MTDGSSGDSKAKYGGMPFGKEIFQKLVPWALHTASYTSEDIKHFCTKIFGISDSQKSIPYPRSGRSIWENNVEFSMGEMTRLKLHVPPAQNDGLRYRVDKDKALKYCIDNGIEIYASTLAALADDAAGETDAMRRTRVRLTQGLFRIKLLRHWGARCPLTGMDDPCLLRASHIKPWSACSSGAERMDAENGLLLAAHIDAAFDNGLITFDRNGAVASSPKLSPDNLRRMGITGAVRIDISRARWDYMRWHRQHIFRSKKLQTIEAAGNTHKHSRHTDLFTM